MYKNQILVAKKVAIIGVYLLVARGEHSLPPVSDKALVEPE
jgi:hypothetical protein